MSHLVSHPFHLVDESPWPLLSSFSSWLLVLGLVKWFHMSTVDLLSLAGLSLVMCAYQWWGDVSTEGTFQGLHTSVVQKGLRGGMILFITSEVMFFVSFFWAFFHSSLSPSPELGLIWAPVGVLVFNPYSIPALNTMILLTSGVSVTWAHHALTQNWFSEAILGLATTVVLGVYFTTLQALEYWEAWFSISDSVFGSVFFVATGFHGLHVLIGTLFLSVGLCRLKWGHFSSLHHLGFEAASWYWHFVDVVWLFLYVWVYWWSAL